SVTLWFERFASQPQARRWRYDRRCQTVSQVVSPESGPRLGVLVGVSVIVIAAVAYGPLLGNDFVNYDDPIYVTGNEHVKEGPTLKNLWWAFTSNYALNWHPLTWISLQLDARVFELSAWGFHLSSLLLHLANSYLLFQILRRMTDAVWRSGLVAALFAV